MGSTASAAPLGGASGATGTFTQVFTDQFDTLNTTTWTRYNGIPTCCPQSGWAKTHVVATDGAMNILTYPTRHAATSGRLAACRWRAR